MPNERWIRAAEADELPPGERKVVQADGRSVLLVHLPGEYVAFESACPHQEFPLDSAPIEGEVLTCPFHGYQYHLRTGENLYPASVYPPDFAHLKQFLRPLLTYPVESRADGIWVALPADD